MWLGRPLDNFKARMDKIGSGVVVGSSLAVVIEEEEREPAVL